MISDIHRRVRSRPGQRLTRQGSSPTRPPRRVISTHWEVIWRTPKGGEERDTSTTDLARRSRTQLRRPCATRDKVDTAGADTSVLSEEVCATLPFRIINVHHSLLPSFAGAKAYHQALERGTERVGATAHYATADLDEGPIIAQHPVSAPRNAESAASFALAGRDAELIVLSRAVRLHCEDRVLPNGSRLMIFD